MNIVGLSAFYHQSACCLLQDGRLVAAAAEERFTRRKHDPQLPVEAFRYCLEQGGITVAEVDAVAYYERPVTKLARQLWAGAPALGDPGLPWLDPRLPERAIRERLGFEGPIDTFAHHASHAASAYFFSGFEDAALLTADGVGEWATTAYGQAAGNELELFETVVFPHSLGLLYSTLTSYLGFAVNDGEYKVMGLAAYGRPRYVDQVCQLIGMGPDGQFLLNLRYFDFVRGRRMGSPALGALFGRPPRAAGEPLEDFHRDLACSLQLVLEEVLLEKLGYLARRTGCQNLCLAGGVALNGVANGRIRRQGPFQRVFVQPAAGDAGACLGAAALAWVARGGERPSPSPMRHAFYGPGFAPRRVARLVEASGVAATDYRRRPAALDDEVAERLAKQQIVGYFQGRMEHGPRALGARSILADPRDPQARERLNRAIKRREPFRPFAPSVLAVAAGDHFDLDRPSPFMLETCRVTSALDLPAITHVDGSARPQTVDPEDCPRFAALIAAFHRRTGCPLVVNTSFNVRDQPIVCTPVDALLTMVTAGLDALVLEDFVIDGDDLPAAWRALVPAWEERAGGGPARLGALRDHLYTFV